MAEKKKSLKRKLFEAGSWSAAKRVGKMIPGVGTAITLGLVGYDIKKKGVIKGVLNSGLDAIPFVGLAKNAVELFTGDFLPDKPEKKPYRAAVSGESPNVSTDGRMSEPKNESQDGQKSGSNAAPEKREEEK